MRDLELVLDKIEDPVARENFERIIAASREDVLGKFVGRFVEYTFEGAVTNFKVPHNLPFQPTDVIQTSLLGGSTVTWVYDSFTTTDVVLTTSSACVVRAFIGTYAE